MDWQRGKGVQPPRWAAILNACGGDPLRAQEIEQTLGGLPNDVLSLVLRAARGDPVRAREIAARVTARWWLRFVEWTTMQSARAEGE
jgi:hypothetical protein